MRCRGNDNGIICKGKKDDSNDADKTGMVEWIKALTCTCKHL